VSTTDDLVAAADHALASGRLADAIEGYAVALAIDPDRPVAWFNRACAERADRRFGDAAKSYRQAIDLGVTRPAEAHLNRAAILSDHLFRPAEAVAELLAAIRCDAAFVPAWLSLGMVHEDQGELHDARKAYRAALELDPANGRAHGRLAMIDVAEGHANEAVARLRLALATARTIEDRIDILFALGNALDALGTYDDAFDAIEAANWLARSIAAYRYDAAAQTTLVDRLIDAFPESVVTTTEASTARPVFICGMFRSGSTLLEQLLARHPAVTGGGESEAIPAMAQRLQPYPEAVPDLTAEQRAAFAADYLREQATIGPGLVTDKRCDNYLHVGLIKALFPGARIIHTVRDPLDTLLSAWFLRFGDGVTWAHDLAEAAHQWKQYERLMAHWKNLWPGDIHDWHYDDAVVDPQGTMSDLLDFLQLDWDEACLGSTPVMGPVRTASALAVRRPLHARSSGRWRHYEARLGPVKRMLSIADGGWASQP
jgi:tetratricopeptide (TPR) repeat protein